MQLAANVKLLGNGFTADTPGSRFSDVEPKISGYDGVVAVKQKLAANLKILGDFDETTGDEPLRDAREKIDKYPTVL